MSFLGNHVCGNTAVFIFWYAPMTCLLLHVRLSICAQSGIASCSYSELYIRTHPRGRICGCSRLTERDNVCSLTISRCVNVRLCIRAHSNMCQNNYKNSGVTLSVRSADDLWHRMSPCYFEPGLSAYPCMKNHGRQKHEKSN